ncbi:hypothetical protein GVN20_14880 [Runella sp. CRIBMP]|uniref:hypothetical protein n=1 Tax=Runella sp. CRIBMP TaxID=2683261 RepID=UPI001412E6F9|nr:hypothetical protein [Runella sp. CRIBMP]NBB20649.1 hypothetical protein [Runella sp. CRIBMP]
MRYGSNGYDVELNYERRSYTFERYKFWGDYNGFVPYVGPTLAYEALADTDGAMFKLLKQKNWSLASFSVGIFGLPSPMLGFYVPICAIPPTYI